jgi:hypothetical protein
MHIHVFVYAHSRCIDYESKNYATYGYELMYYACTQMHTVSCGELVCRSHSIICSHIGRNDCLLIHVRSYSLSGLFFQSQATSCCQDQLTGNSHIRVCMHVCMYVYLRRQSPARICRQIHHIHFSWATNCIQGFIAPPAFFRIMISCILSTKYLIPSISFVY